MPQQDQAKSLWLAWQADHSPQVRTQLVDYYLPFTRMLAATLYAKRPFPELEFMDYFQSASLGLLESIDRFDLKRGISFETFAGVRIKGAILNGIQSFSEKQEQVHARQRLINERVQQLHGAQAGAGAGAGTDKHAIDQVFACLAEIAIGLAMGFVLEDTGMLQAEESPAYHDNTYQRVELKQLQQRLRHYLDALPDNEKRIVNYHYMQHLGFDEIARIIGLSKGRISQLHKQALERMRTLMQAAGGIDIRY